MLSNSPQNRPLKLSKVLNQKLTIINFLVLSALAACDQGHDETDILATDIQDLNDTVSDQILDVGTFASGESSTKNIEDTSTPNPENENSYPTPTTITEIMIDDIPPFSWNLDDCYKREIYSQYADYPPVTTPVNLHVWENAEKGQPDSIYAQPDLQGIYHDFQSAQKSYAMHGIDLQLRGFQLIPANEMTPLVETVFGDGEYRYGEYFHYNVPNLIAEHHKEGILDLFYVPQFPKDYWYRGYAFDADKLEKEPNTVVFYQPFTHNKAPGECLTQEIIAHEIGHVFGLRHIETADGIYETKLYKNTYTCPTGESVSNFVYHDVCMSICPGHDPLPANVMEGERCERSEEPHYKVFLPEQAQVMKCVMDRYRGDLVEKSAD